MQRTISVRNPRTGEHDYVFTPPETAEIVAICRDMRREQSAWGAAPLEERLAVLRKWADAIEASATVIGDAEFADTGRYRRSHEVPLMVVKALRSWCERAAGVMEKAYLQGDSSTFKDVTFETQLMPYPLVGIISPWNQPFLLSTMDAIPALVAGCAVIIKPSEVTPRFIEPVMSTIRAVPELAKVLRYVQGDGKVGQDIIQQVDMQCFTGSVPTGRLVAEACAKRFIPAFLELGGKDAAIVTENADIERAATAVLRGSVWCTGQICFATERVYVQESVHDRFVKVLSEQANALRVTYPDHSSGEINPFIFERQAEIVDRHIDDALAKGARIVAGGKSQRLGGGLYMEATVMTDVTHDMAIMTEETFGPITPVMKYKTEEDAVRLANDTQYGLSGSVIGGDMEEAIRIGRQLNAGAIALQDTAITEAILRDAEKNSFNKSGMGGSRMGPSGLLRFFRKKALIMNHGRVKSMAEESEDTFRSAQPPQRIAS